MLTMTDFQEKYSTSWTGAVAGTVKKKMRLCQFTGLPSHLNICWFLHDLLLLFMSMDRKLICVQESLDSELNI